MLGFHSISEQPISALGNTSTPGAFSIDAQPATYVVTGFAATLARGLYVDAQPATYVITGFAATLARGLFVDAQPATYVISGIDATLIKLTGFPADPATYTINAFDAALVYSGAGAGEIVLMNSRQIFVNP